ncbi:MAG: HAD-IIB family hydrolase [Lachnospiraceae bacterium]|nr:HAD-IIB family hydrolase [Lachnospiraceae bacterium]
MDNKILGLKRGTVQLEKHNPAWEIDAKNVIDKLKAILGNAAKDVQHIGSTAIRNIYAKPIIDIVVGLENVNDILKYKPELENEEIIYRGSRQPGQLLFVKGNFEQDTRTHHIHIVKYNGFQWNSYIAFRDYLNVNQETAKKYETLKLELAAEYPTDRVAYTDGKKALIMKITEEANKNFRQNHTLYVSDLDGTLLNSSQRTSEYTNTVINRLVEKGMLFSYATARSYQTASKVTYGLLAEIPLIVYNGVMIVNNRDGAVISKTSFGNEAENILNELVKCDIYPLVYSFIDGVEKYSFVEGKCSEGMKEFLAARKNDARENCVQKAGDLFAGEIFYFTCIDEAAKLFPLYEKYCNNYTCFYQEDIYTKRQWLEIMPKAAAKANAIMRLKEIYGCDRVVVFGDGKNDISMFEIADESYAVANAVQELKEIATGVIESNDDDGVAKWLEREDARRNK